MDTPDKLLMRALKLCAPLALIVVSGQAIAADSAAVSGTVTYRERMALPPNALLHASLEDVSRADARADVVGQVEVRSPGQPPIHFSISYDPQRLEAGHRYGVRARIVEGDRLLFTSDQYLAVDLEAASAVQIVLKRASTPSVNAIPSPVKLPATYSGDLPCAACEGLRYQLDLFADGLYFSRVTYLGKSGVGVDAIGKWVITPEGRRVRLLKGSAIAEQLEIVNEDTLRKLDREGRPIHSQFNYDLKRQPAFSPIEPSLRLRGMYSYIADAGSFIECASGRRLPVAQEGDNAALESAYARDRVSTGAPRLATVEGRIAVRPSPDGGAQKLALVVNRFVQVSRGQCGGDAREPPLQNTYWKLVHLEEEAPVAAGRLREPHLILHPDAKRVTGFGGCNRLTGTYILNGEQLAFSQVAGTMMMCPQGMETEKSFQKALAQVVRWHISNGRLELLNSQGDPVAQFERVLMK